MLFRSDAITKRLDVLIKNVGMSGPQTELLSDQAVEESTQVPISDTYEGHEDQMPGRSPLQDHEIPPGGSRGLDGEVYAPHPQMPGVLARVSKEI